VPLVDKPLEGAEEHGHIFGMEADGRLVEQIENLLLPLVDEMVGSRQIPGFERLVRG
jgi:hypothetical protein